MRGLKRWLQEKMSNVLDQRGFLLAPLASAIGDTDGEIFGRNFFRSKNFLVKQIFDRKHFRPKNCSVDFFSPNKCSAANCFSQKVLRGNGFSIETFFGQKIFRQKNCRPEIFRRKKKIGPKILQSNKFQLKNILANLFSAKTCSGENVSAEICSEKCFG